MFQPVPASEIQLYQFDLCRITSDPDSVSESACSGSAYLLLSLHDEISGMVEYALRVQTVTMSMS